MLVIMDNCINKHRHVKYIIKVVYRARDTFHIFVLKHRDLGLAAYFFVSTHH